MKKIALIVIAALMLGACLPISAPTPAAPTANIAASAQAALPTAAPPTLTSLPPVVAAPATDTPLPPPAALPSDTPTIEFFLASPAPNLTTTLETATNAPVEALATATLAVSGSATSTATLGILTYGTLPPAVPFSSVTLVNKSKTQAYISLQVTTVQGGPTIIEYPVERTVKIKAPIGEYLYVAWVGGRKMIGNFKLHKNEELTITLFRDKVVIQ